MYDFGILICLLSSGAPYHIWFSYRRLNTPSPSYCYGRSCKGFLFIMDSHTIKEVGSNDDKIVTPHNIFPCGIGGLERIAGTTTKMYIINSIMPCSALSL
ncbi:unnamed protein product [Lactuca virosa]|uniref:Uncharacterized protein n=1 Tax=Lactuca virosa TaxID=75947 RepID=A0AAU9NGI7_9ASTR|nr:unnamed protein product [Lactuca virosa]